MNDSASAQEQLLPVTRDPSLSLDWSQFGANVAEAVANFLIKGWADGGVSSLAALSKALGSIKIGNTAAERSWALTALGFSWAVGNLRDIYDIDEDAVRASLRSSINKAKESVDAGEQHTPATFLDRPTTSPLYAHLKRDLLNSRETFAISDRLTRDQLTAKLDISFNRAIFEVWSRDIERFNIIREHFDSAGREATIFDMNWHSYRQSLIHSFDVSPVFGQDNTNISLSQIYVPLRAFWTEGEAPRVSLGGARVPQDAHVVLLDNDLSDWITGNDDNDWLRLIGGGPGSGKSTTLRALARKYADSPDWRPLFIPLQHIGIAGDLREAINRHFSDRSDGAFTQPPLSRSSLEDGAPLILIFDGLDELVAPNDAANDVINTFTALLTNLIAALKGDGGRRIKVVVSGRMPAFQAASRFLVPRKNGCLEAFGYLSVDPRELTNKEHLWTIDQREIWWKQYAAATNQDRHTPPALQALELAGITHEPLQCYLLVLAGYATNDWEKAAENPNRIYATLMTNIYERGWGEGIRKRHGPGKSMSLPDFLTLMETIGLAAWLGGDARVATEQTFKATLPIMKAENAWTTFNADNGPDVTNLAMNFYLEAAEGHQRGFEFTHKSFGEYLAARALIAVAHSTYDLVERRIGHAMQDWSDATKTGIITGEILTFMRDEVRLQLADSDGEYVDRTIKIKGAFETLANAISLGGFSFNNSTNWRVQESYQINSECCAWAIINTCALGLYATGDYINCKVNVLWNSHFELRNLLIRQSGPLGWASTFSSCLAFIVAPNAFLFGIPLVGADFHGADLQRVIFDSGRIYSTSFEGCNLTESSFHGTSFSDVKFDGAILGSAGMFGCRLRECNLSEAKVDGLIVTKETILMSDETSFAGLERRLRLSDQQDGFSEPFLLKLEEANKFIDKIPRQTSGAGDRTTGTSET